MSNSERLLCAKSGRSDFISGKFFSRQNRKGFFTNSIKVGLDSTFIYAPLFPNTSGTPTYPPCLVIHFQPVLQ
jgi:hypothetical protein